ncbi:MAG TPA: geranylgeranyl reductase family protein [Ornithinimicrobium sp.]|uniref:geranylgeranyl reductase family protein n=1 Tax=Ornithinimicrobium sp. TaxID=1977084 RepID=UPI002B486BB8|nr:geranylgeranyl reductase family protein [Ornithinimicrobium sp.]HKJ11516.1 geranylgeranyl reductase family protein [Ornithinimicrobium sp.]
MLWDVAIVGAGPAGSTAAVAALRARPDARVLLLDRADFPRDKACGDGIAPHVFDVWSAIDEPLDIPDHPEVWSLSLDSGRVRVRREMARPARVVPRTTFDDALVERAVRRGAVLRRHRVRQVDVTADHVVLDEQIAARAVVAADGAHSAVARLAGATGCFAGRSAFALRGYAPTPDSRRGMQIIRFGLERQPSYAWSFDCGDGWSNVGYGEVVRQRPGQAPLTRELMVRGVEMLLPGATDGAVRWLGHHLPLSRARFNHPAGRIVFAGDAAGLVNPLTGEGIYYAVATGALAGRCAVTLAPHLLGRRYESVVRRLLARHLRTTATAARLAGRPRLLDVGLTAASGDQHAFDALVEIGLGAGVVSPRLVSSLARAGSAAVLR